MDYMIMRTFIETFSSLFWFSGVTLLFGFSLTVDLSVFVAPT